MFNKSKGFTIIELLVVVAIIAVLAAIVLVNVTQYINKGRNASIEANLSSVLTNGAVWEDTYGDYGVHSGTNFCGSISYTGPAASITNSHGTPVCQVSTSPANTHWCACSPLNVTSTIASGTVFCVDDSGAKKQVVSTDCTTECPSAAGQCQ